MEAAPSIVAKLWEKVSYDEALGIVKEHEAWDSCVEGMMVLHPSISFEDALVLLVFYEDPLYKPYKEIEMKAITDEKMREFIRLDMKQRCKSHGSLMFDELYILAKYKYLSLKN
jgi:hypothetical protein